MSDEHDRGKDATEQPAGVPALPATPHELPLDRAAIDALLTRVRDGERIDLLDALLGAVEWSAFRSAEGAPLSALERAGLDAYFRDKFADVGPLYLAELLSTEFMTEQRARGDIVFSERLLALGRTEPELWAEIRQFFRRKEIVTGLLLLAHQPAAAESSGDADASE
ncbi:MAG TPA: hypothetical protein VFQ80_01295 [Thermomicrobiales bacterium]|nr:hypothetical protein [Thermomicrobiales bacterium]